MEKTCFPKSPAPSAAALGSGSTCISPRSSACSLAARASPALIFSLAHACSRGGNTAAVQASCTAPFHPAASALQTAFERGSLRTTVAGFPTLPAMLPPLPPHRSAASPRLPRTQLAETAGSRCATENPQLCLISIFLDRVGNLSGAQLCSCLFMLNCF